jgi:hypothetical protein
MRDAVVTACPRADFADVTDVAGAGALAVLVAEHVDYRSCREPPP